MLWFFLNLLFLAVVAVGVTQVHLRLGVSALLSGRAEERLHALTDQLKAQLDRRAETEWSAVLARTAAEYHLQIGVFRNDGARLAGAIDPLPAEVQARLQEMDRPPEHRPPTGSASAPACSILPDGLCAPPP